MRSRLAVLHAPPAWMPFSRLDLQKTFAEGRDFPHDDRMANEEGSVRTDLAEDRTDLAEDRTLLANERTFSGWARTATACIGIGLGFSALFKAIEPTWVAKSIATVFILLGVFLVIVAERRARRLHDRLTAHHIAGVSPINFRVMAVAISVAAAALIVAIWWLT